MRQLELYKAGADGSLVFNEGEQPCPGCCEVVTFKVCNGGMSVDVLHPEPPCAPFREFVERLQSAHIETTSHAC